VSATIASILAEITDKVKALPGVVAYEWDNDRIATVPAALVGLPDRTQYRLAYSKYGKKLTVSLVVLVSKANARAAQKTLLPFIESSGDRSIFRVVDSEFTHYSTCDDVTVVECEPDIWINAGVPYLGAEFTLDVTATGV
jgi:hypothetical protein